MRGDTARVLLQAGERGAELDAAAQFPEARVEDTPSAAARASFIAYSFTLGFVIEEQSVEPRPGERAPGYDVTEREERMAAEGYPLAAAVSSDLFLDYEARFEEGLRAIVAGIEATLAPAAPAAPAA
ncbi:hypothetical protein M271_28765, partial [Streptomyces rapamycinicus NRRL 5491]